MKFWQFDRILRIANYMICLVIQINYICPVKRNKAFSRHAHEAMQISSFCFFIITIFYFLNFFFQRIQTALLCFQEVFVLSNSLFIIAFYFHFVNSFFEFFLFFSILVFTSSEAASGIHFHYRSDWAICSFRSSP